MKKILLLLVTVILSSNLMAQNDPQLGTSQNNEVMELPEVHAEFPGGAFREYIKSNLKYPESAKEKGIEGRVFVSFFVEKDGSISNVEVLKGIGGGCDEVAANLIKQSPKWKPAEMRYKPVRQKIVLPIIFKLDQKK